MADGVKGIVTLAGLVVVGYLTPPKDQASRKTGCHWPGVRV